jgi:mRNA-degrading endonuclease toxin of MazEF toxin-antitoxin module
LATPKAGDVFLHHIVLPGESSGGKHLCVCLSREEYANETGMAVLASLRRVRSSWWRPLVDLPDYTPTPGFLPLDGPRAVDTSQMVSVSIAALARIAGVVTRRVVSETMAVVPALFQLKGPWEVRGAVHRIVGWPDRTAAVLVLNDSALDNPDLRHYLVMPYEDGWWRLELVLVNAADLGEEVRVLSNDEQARLSKDLAGIFPLTG